MTAQQAMMPSSAGASKLGPLKSLVVVASMILFSQASELFAVETGGPSLIRASAGIAVAVLVLYGLRNWPLVIAAAIGTTLIYHLRGLAHYDSLLDGIIVRVACASQSVLVAWALRRTIGSRPLFRKPNEVLLYFGVVAGCTLAGTLLDLGVIEVLGYQRKLSQDVLGCWMGHLVGIGAFGPLVLLWVGDGPPRLTRNQWLQGLAYQTVLTAALLWASSAQDATDPRIVYRLDLLVLPVIVVSTLGFGPKSGAVAIPVTLVIEAAMVASGRGWIHLTSGGSTSTAFQVVMLVLELAGFFAGALAAQYQDVNAALGDSEERYRALVEDSPIGIMVSQNQRIVFANQTAADIMAAQSPSELVGLSFADCLGSSPDENGSGDPLAAFTTGASTNQTILRSDKQPIEIELVATRATHEGKPALYVSFSDVTERRRAEQALCISEQRLATIFEFSPYMIVLSDFEELRILDVNDSGLEMLGLTREQVIGRDHVGLGVWSDPNQVAALRRELAEHGRASGWPVKLIHRDGHTIDALLSSELVEIDGEKVSLTVGIDITQQLAAQQALEASEERYRQLSAMMADIAYEAHLEGGRRLVMDWATGAIETMLGYSHTEFQTMSLNQSAFHPDDLEAARGHLGKVLAGQDDEAEFRIERANGGYCWVLNSMHPKLDANGEVTHLLGAAKDITDRRALEDQLMQSQKMEAVGRLAGGIAHDFNNLLTIINGYAEMTAALLDAEHPIQPDIAEILRAGERAAELTRQLLAFSRAEMRLVQPLGLNQLIKGMRRMLERVLREDIHMVLNLSPEVGVIHGDPTQLEQVVLNLVINARDALVDKEPPGGTLVIRTETVEVVEPFRAHEHRVDPGLYTLLSVEDDGPGIPDEIRDHLFEPFFTTKEVGRGTGLGLATVYGIVRQNGGYVTVDSVKGKGSAFHVGWPSAREMPSLALPKVQETDILDTTGSVLIVEDAEGVRRLTGAMLTSLGFEVTQASSGAEALALLADPDLHVDLLLTDMVMPEMGGKECAELALRMRPDLPILLMTGYSDDLVNMGSAADDLPILPKPFDRHQLSSAIQEAFDRHGK